jgi:hypothetical protein
MVGGGVRGRGVGTAHGTTTQVGITIEEFRPFMDGYTQTGKITTGIIIGEGIVGTTNEYLTTKLNETGKTGEEVGIGNNKIGVSKVCDPERGHNHNIVRKVHNTEMVDQGDHSNKRETMEKGKDKNRVKGKVKKGFHVEHTEYEEG